MRAALHRAAVWLVACGSLLGAPLHAIAEPPGAAPPVHSQRVFSGAIQTRAEFDAYAKRVGAENALKFIIDVRTSQIIYFDVNVYSMHTEFVFKEIFERPITNEGLFQFNRNYSPHKPQFILGYINEHVHHGKMTLSFFSGDLLTADHVRYTLARVRETFWAADKLAFMPDSTHQARIAQELRGELAIITRASLYKAEPYQAFNPGRGVGYLRIVTPEQAANPEDLTVATTDIVVLPHDLPDISVVSGILTETFSTPLAHVALRARAWGVPHAGFRGAAAAYRALAGKPVVLEVTRESHTLRVATPAEVEAWQAALQKPREVVVPPVDRAARALKRLTEMRATEAGAYGAKAANLGEVARARMPGFTVPAGFGIPVVYYWEHLQTHGLDARITALLADERLTSDATWRKGALASLRQAIREAPLDAALLRRVLARRAELGLPVGGGVFVRSSTNAEDLPGFNGAGLYDTVPNVKTDEALSSAIRRVWASVWNQRAFDERQHFGIDHAAVHGAVLVQIGINATAAGVLITADLYNPDNEFVYTINAKSGLGIRVVQGRKIPEQILFDLATLTMKVISRSDEATQLVFDPGGGVREVPVPSPGAPVLNDRRAHALTRACQAMTDLFEWSQPADVEWLFEGEELHIVQIRPYIVP